MAEPTRRTLVYPAVDLARSRRAAAPPPLPGPRFPPSRSRPSERPTMRTLPPVDEAPPGTSNTEVIELSASALDSEPSVLDVGLGRGLALQGELHGSSPGPFERIGGWRSRARAVKRWLGYVTLAGAGAGALLAANAVANVELSGTPSLVERVTGLSDGLHASVRTPNEAVPQHTPLLLRAVGHEPTVPAGACAIAGPSRVLAKRAHLAAGLDVNVLDGAFGVGFATGGDEALGMRLDGAPMRVADRVRVHAPSGVRHVAVDGGRSDEDAIDVRIDADDARTVVPDRETPAFRVMAAGGWIHVLGAGLAKGRVLWPVPGGSKRAGEENAKAKAPATTATATATTTVKSDAIVGALIAARGPPAERLDVRAAARDEGGAVVALRRPSALWLGLIDGRFAAEGPLLPLTRPGAAIGMPSVAPRGTGGAVAWAERPAGDHDWLVMVASFGEAIDTGAHEPPAVRVIAAGMSPSIAMLPDGGLLLAYAVGIPGAHRVVVRRLGRDLEPRGEPLLVSPQEINAGQPAAAVASDGRGLVAFFGAEHGRPPSVVATPLACATHM